MLLALGEDAFATPLEASLREAGVELQLIRSNEQPTGTAFICVSDDAENAITVAPGANQCLQPAHLPSLQGVSHLLMQLETPLATVTAYARTAKAQGVSVVLNAAPARALPPELVDALDVLIVNQGELATVAGHDGTIAQALARLPVPTVVVTLGHHGCVARHQGVFYWQPAYRVTPVDTTGAGDTFCGALVAALSQGADMAQALRLASAAGALACTRLGAQSSIPHAHAVATFLAQQPVPNATALNTLRQFCGLA
jgi:ribokinase